MEEPEDLTQLLADNNKQIAAINAQIIEATAQFQDQLKAYVERDQQLRGAIIEGMKVSGTKKFENEYIKFVYVEPTTRRGVDLDRLKFQYPDIYNEVEKITNVKESVRITIK